MTGWKDIMEVFSWQRLAALALITLCAVQLCAGDLEVSVRPNPATAGSPTELRLSHTGDEFPEIIRMPDIDGISWKPGASRRSQITIINGKRVAINESLYHFTVEKPGSYKFPPLQVNLGKLKTVSAEIDFKALPARVNVQSSSQASGGGAGKALDIDELIHADIEILSPKKAFYVGEEIPAEVKLSYAQGLRVQMSWPEMDFGKNKADAVFRDYSSSNSENPKFDTPSTSIDRSRSIPFQVYTFRTAFRAIAPGTLTPSAKMTASIFIPETGRRRQSMFDDDFFFGDPFSRGRNVERTLHASGDSIEILPLPQPPKDIPFIGLVGDWRMDISMPECTCRVGEPVSIKVSISGDGSLDTLKPPPLELKGFRVYPPELDRRGPCNATVNYLLIPAESGEEAVNVRLCTFNTNDGKYSESSLSRTLKVEKSNGIPGVSPGGLVLDAGTDSQSVKAHVEAQSAKRKRPTEALYLKPSLSGSVAMPLWRNSIIASILMIVIGVAFWIFCELLHARRAAIATDPGLMRRESARSLRKALISRLSSCKPEELPVASNDIAEYLNRALDCPPGSGLSELASKVKAKSPELSECLESLAHAAWSQESSAFSQGFKERLLKTLSKFSAVIVLSILCLGSIAAYAAAPSTPEEALTAYDTGNFKGAADFYKSRLDSANPSPAALYNIGNCLYQSGDLPRALACYEQARKLSPRDSDIFENLNLTRRKLSLPETGLLDTPSDAITAIRDFLRPDEWLLAAAAAIAASFVAIGLRKLAPSIPNLWKALLAMSVVAAIASIVAIASQMRTSYSEKSAVVTLRNAPLFSIPSEQAGRTDSKLQAGEEISVEELRNDWARVRSGNAEGWMNISNIAPLWSADRIPSPGGL